MQPPEHPSEMPPDDPIEPSPEPTKPTPEAPAPEISEPPSTAADLTRSTDLFAASSPLPPPAPMYSPSAPNFAPGSYQAIPHTWYNPSAPPRVMTHRPAWQIWFKAWTLPWVDDHRELLNEEDTTLMRSMKWLAIGFVVDIVIAVIYGVLFGFDRLAEARGAQFDASAFTDSSLSGAMCAVVVCLPILIAFIAVLYLLLVVGIPHVIARLFGGSGEFEHTAFLYTAILMPPYYLNTFTDLLPLPFALELVLGIIWLVVAIYVLFLQSTTLKAVHNINWVVAIVAALSPFVLFFGFFCGLGVLIGLAGA